MTPKQQRFVDEYLVDLNATQAATRAGYSASTAYSQGERLLRNVEVATAIAKGKQERAADVGVDARWVLKRLYDEAQADLADLYTETGSLRPIHEWPLVWRQGLVAGIETVREGKGDEEASFVDKVKLSDRVKRIELLGKHVDVSAFAERLIHDITDDMASVLNQARQSAA